MRVLLTSGRGPARRRRDESGAVAVTAALVSLILVAVAAFTTDLGMAYVNKRQLQTASDAAVLAAAQVYSRLPGTCSALAANAAARAQAQTTADQYRSANAPSSTGSSLTAACADGDLEVTYSSTRPTPSFFAGIFGVDQITASRQASATVGVASNLLSGLRPLALCSAALPATTPSGTVVRVDYPGGGLVPPLSCPTPKTPGDWWTLDCPGERTGATSQLEEQIKNGCPEEISIVPGQETALTPVDLSLKLLAACPSAPLGSETCLSGDPGSLDAGHIPDSWAYLVDQQAEVFLPVFCAPTTCVPTTLTGTGTNAVFPVHKLAGVVVCGYHFNKKEHHDSHSGPCAANPYNVDSDTSQDNYLVLVFKQVLSSGSTRTSTCDLGDTCDAGARKVTLSQ